jgi:zinc transport system permease protein
MNLPGILDVFGYDYMQRALVAGLLIALVCTLVGVFTVLRGMALISDGLAHISFAGIAVGLVLGIFPLQFAIVAAVLGAIGIQFVREKGWVKSDVAIGLFFTTGLATGVAIISRSKGLSVNVTSYLFGSILSVTPRDVAWVLGLTALLMAAITVFYKELLYVAFNEEAARVSGLPVGAINLGTSILTGICVGLASRIVGVLLVSALIIVPAAAVLQLSRDFRETLIASAGVGMIAVLAGLYWSFVFDIAPGASIALVSMALFGLAASYKAVRHGSA